MDKRTYWHVWHFVAALAAILVAQYLRITHRRRPHRLITRHSLGPVAMSLLLVLSGCAGTERPAGPSVEAAYLLHGLIADGLGGGPDPKERKQFSGFSVMPPDGPDWSESAAEPSDDHWKTQIIFWRAIAEPHPERGPHTAFAVVRNIALTSEIRSRLETVDDQRGFMEAMMNQTLLTDQAAAIAAGGLRIAYQKAVLDETLGYECFSYAVAMEGRGSSEDKEFDFVMDLHSFICLDPALGMIVQTAYSQLVPRGDTAIDLSREGDAFLKSIVFSGLAHDV